MKDKFNLNNVKSAVSRLMGIGQNIAAGAKYAGAPGAIVAAAVSATAEFIGWLNRMNSVEVSIKKQNYQTAILRERSGLDVYTDGSRGTEN